MIEGGSMTAQPDLVGANRARGAVLVALCLIGQSTPIMQPMFVGAMVEFMGLSERTAGLVSALEMSAFGIAALVVAASLARFSLRAIGIAGVVLTITGNFLACVGTTFELLVAARAMAGAGAGAAFALGSAMAAATARPDRTFALLAAGVLVYAGIFIATVPIAIQAHGLAGGYAAVAAVAVVIGFAALKLPATRNAPNHRSAGTGCGMAPLSIVLLLGASFLLYAGHGAVWTYQERMGSAIGMSRQSVGAALGAAAIAGLTGALAAAWLGTRWGRLWPLTGSLLVSSAAALLVVQASTGAMYAVASSLIACSWFFGLPYLNGLAAQADRSGKLASMVAAMLNFGQAAGPFAAAFVVGQGGYVGIGWAAATAYALCAVLVARPVARASL